MSDGPGLLQPAASRPSGGGSTGTWAWVALIFCLVAAILYAGNLAMRTMQARDAAKQTEEKTVQSTGLITPAPKPLASRFTDTQGRMLADPPAAAEQLVDPDVLVVAHIAGDAENPAPTGGSSRNISPKSPARR